MEEAASQLPGIGGGRPLGFGPNRVRSCRMVWLKSWKNTSASEPFMMQNQGVSHQDEFNSLDESRSHSSQPGRPAAFKELVISVRNVVLQQLLTKKAAGNVTPADTVSANPINQHPD